MPTKKVRGSLAAVSEPKSLRSAWAEMQLLKRGAARKIAGSDGVSINRFADALDDNLTILSQRLRTRTFAYSPLLPHFEQKASGKERVICVPTVRDRIVQRALLAFLQEHDGGRFAFKTDASYGFVKGRDVKAAIDRAKKLRTQKRWAYKTDIRSFFDEIPRDQLKAKIRSKIRLPGILPLLLAACDCEAKTANNAETQRLKSLGVRAGRGLRQGMPLSPYFSNVFLAGFDQKIAASAIDMVRYADDLVCFAESEAACKAIDELCRAELGKIGLSIHPLNTPDKCEIRSPDQPVEFLGVELAPKDGGYIFRLSDKQIEKKKKLLFDMSNIDELLKQRLTISRFVQRIRARIDGWEDAYEHCDNIAEFRDKLENWRQSVFEKVFVNGLGIPKLNVAAKQFLELVELPKPQNDKKKG